MCFGFFRFTFGMNSTLVAPKKNVNPTHKGGYNFVVTPVLLMPRSS